MAVHTDTPKNKRVGSQPAILGQTSITPKWRGKPTNRDERERWGSSVRAGLAVVWLALALLEESLPPWMGLLLGIYTLSCFAVLWLTWRRALTRPIQILMLVMDVSLLTVGIHFVGASLSFPLVIYPLIVVSFSLMAGRALGLAALLASIGAYGTLLTLEVLQLLPKVEANGSSAGHGEFAEIMAFGVISATSIGVFVLLAISIKRTMSYSDREHQLLEAEHQAKMQSEKLSVQLEQTKRLEGIGRLAGGVAHEFNNVLTVILGYSRFVSDELPLDSPLRDDIREVVTSAERAAALTSQLLSFGRKQMFHKRLVDLTGLLASYGKRLANDLPPGVEIEILVPDSAVEALVDPSCVGSMLQGLVDNALEAMPQGGKLRLRLTRSIVGVTERIDTTGLWGECAIIEVTDTGMGMDDAVRNRIFEPFFSTKAAADGRGMGLATIYGAARQLGGSVEAESSLGQGTTLRILLPTAVDLRHTQRSSIPPTPTRTVPVLLVEDEELVRRVTARILNKAGFLVHQAENADAALALIKGEAADIELLVTDIIMMPGKNGVELASLLHVERPTLPVLFVSGYTDQQSFFDEIPSSPRCSLLPKPFSEDDLLREINHLLGRPSDPTSSS